MEQPMMGKTLSFAIVHFSVAFTVGYLVTGSVLAGGTIALLEPMVNTVAYHVHEKAWMRRTQLHKADHGLAAA